jgi:hypothetical protein
VCLFLGLEVLSELIEVMLLNVSKSLTESLEYFASEFETCRTRQISEGTIFRCFRLGVWVCSVVVLGYVSPCHLCLRVQTRRQHRKLITLLLIISITIVMV